MKKKVIGILLFFISSIIVLFVVNATAIPLYGNEHNSAGCHNSLSGAYTITINTTGIITADNSSVTSIEITATGSNLFVQARSDAGDNSDFGILPSNLRILDNSGSDTDPSLNAMTVVFNVTTPATDAYYTLFIIAGDNLAGRPEFAYANIGFSIGGILPPLIPFDYIGFWLFHGGSLLIGGIAIITLGVGTVLYLVNQEKFTKAHGLLAGTSLILTTVNIITIVPTLVSRYTLRVPGLDLTLLHMILGSIGYIAGIIAFLAGLSGHRSRLPGFIALACWSFNYIQGIFSILGVYIL